jgi:hypothetical protein
MLHIGLVVLLITGGADSSVSQSGSTAATDPSSKKVSSEVGTAKVCRKIQPELGTRIPERRVCKTQKAWDDEAHAAQEDWRQRHKPASGSVKAN